MQNSETEKNEQATVGERPVTKDPLRLLVEILKHPFVLLVIGATVTSLLVPYLNSKVTRNQLSQEARLKKAIEIGDHNMEFNSKFNALKTMLESFHRRSVRLKLEAPEFREAHSRFVDDFSKRYLDLDEKAWWWYPALEREASVLRLISTSELQQMDSELADYGNNLNQSFNLLRPLWQELTSHNYNPGDKNSIDKVEGIITDVKKDLPSTFEARNKLIERIAGHFSTPQ